MNDQRLGKLRIVSGGQTGVDRAALDFAIRHGVPHGGWCPSGRRAEDGPLATKYDLRETPSRNYRQRTRWNVRDSDATVLFTIDPELSGGTKLTAEIALREGKPLLHLCAERENLEQAATRLRRFLDEHNVFTLNVAGPRAEQPSAVSEFVDGALSQALLDE